MERRLLKGFGVTARPPASLELAAVQQQLAGLSGMASELQETGQLTSSECAALSGQIAALATAIGLLGNAAGAHGVALSALQQGLVALEEALAAIVTVTPHEGAPRGEYRSTATLTLSGLLAVGKQWKDLACPGLAVGDHLTVTAAADLPVQILIGEARCKEAGKLRIAVATLVAVSLGATSVTLDVIAKK